MRKLIVLLLVVALAVGAWIYFGGLDRVTQTRVQTALTDAGVPETLATCMAPRMVDRLSLNQLRKLERMGPQDGETVVPLSSAEALARLRRVDDPEAVEMTVRAAGGCALESMLEGM